MANKSLKYGETPWDDLPREELLKHVQRMWSTIVSLESVTLMMKGLDAGPFWSTIGTGGQALEKARQVRASIDSPPGSEKDEQIYRGFFRYATDLLFDHSKYRIGFGWMVCEKEGKTWAGGPGEAPPTKCHDCGETLRPIEWKDILPKRST